MLEVEALIGLLNNKGIVTEDELIGKIGKMTGKIPRCLFYSQFGCFALG